MRVQKFLSWAIVASECSHVFCCVLPTLVSIASLMTGLGLLSALPASILEFHEFMHKWEMPMIGVSGLILALGWLAHAISVRIDCHDTGCGLGPCTPKKRKASGVLLAATALFVFNVLVYFAFHADLTHPH